VQGGALTITAKPDPTTSGYPGSWESGLITTQGNFSQKYGHFEVRADFSSQSGAWDAFWLMPDKQIADPNKAGGWQELDVVEHYGNYDAGVYSTIHTTDSQNGVPWQDNRQVFSASANPAGYHTYGVNWQSDRISFYVDGELKGSQATPSDMRSPMYLMTNLATQDGASGGSIASHIDYIRAYSNDPNATAVTQGAVSAPDGRDPGLYGARAATATASGGTGTSSGTTTGQTATAGQTTTTATNTSGPGDNPGRSTTGQSDGNTVSGGTTASSGDTATNTGPSPTLAGADTDHQLTTGAANTASTPSQTEPVVVAPQAPSLSSAGSTGTAASGSETQSVPTATVADHTVPVSPPGTDTVPTPAATTSSTPVDTGSAPNPVAATSTGYNGLPSSTGGNDAFRAFTASPKARAAALSAQKKIVQYAEKHPESAGLANRMLETLMHFW